MKIIVERIYSSCYQRDDVTSKEKKIGTMLIAILIVAPFIILFTS